MMNERLQILVTSEQRRRLEAEARRRETSVASVIREAIDAQFGSVTKEDRLSAVEGIARGEGGRFLSVEELEEIVGSERDEVLPRRSTGRAS